MRFDIYFGTRPAILFEDLIALEIIHPHDKQGDLKGNVCQILKVYVP